jgi:AAA+ superfamily predicted ATPase
MGQLLETFMNDTIRLAKLIQGGSPCISIHTFEESYALETLHQAADALKRDLCLWSFGRGVRTGALDFRKQQPDTEKPGAALTFMASQNTNPLCVTLDMGPHLQNNPLVLRIMRDSIDRLMINNGTLVMIDSLEILPEVIRSYTAPFELSLPDEKELDQIVRSTLQTINCKRPIEIGITKKGFESVLKNLRGLTRRQAQQLIRETVTLDRRFTDGEVNRILAGKRRMLQTDGLLTYIQTPLDLDEIGGLDNLKRWLKLRKEAFRSEAGFHGLRPPRGVLMVGVQGAGKSLCAKAIATAWQLPLLRLDPGNLYNSYIGQSEQNLRKALQQIEMISPVILWIDEIEKGFASAASQSVDGGLSQRMFATLLTWMQEHEAPVFLIATANDIAALPPELLRKGRFDEIFFVGLPKRAARRKIFEIHLKKRNREPLELDLDQLATASEGFSGAEIEQAIVSALHETYAGGTPLSTENLLQSLNNSPPLSVTMDEHVRHLCEWAKGRCVPAD